MKKNLSTGEKLLLQQVLVNGYERLTTLQRAGKAIAEESKPDKPLRPKCEIVTPLAQKIAELKKAQQHKDEQITIDEVADRLADPDKVVGKPVTAVSSEEIKHADCKSTKGSLMQLLFSHRQERKQHKKAVRLRKLDYKKTKLDYRISCRRHRKMKRETKWMCYAKCRTLQSFLNYINKLINK